MAPRESETSKSDSFGVIKYVDGLEDPENVRQREIKKTYKYELSWSNIIALSILHVGGLYGGYLSFTRAQWPSFIFGYIYLHISAWGVTAGAHRLWAHRAYKAKWQLRVLLVFLNCIAFQHSIIRWVRDHRVHHKHSETDADPYNIKRGFFFAHMGWLLIKKHPDVKEKGKGIDMSDLYADPILRFQHKYYPLLVAICCFAIPTAIPIYFWNEPVFECFLAAALFRYLISLHVTWLVNSAAHMFGNKPYDKDSTPTENRFVSLLTHGEGWHNYHHVFPWDYKTAELGNYTFNYSTAMIDFFAWIGWAYDLKTVSPDMIKQRVMRTGDGSHELWGCETKKKKSLKKYY